MGLRFSKRIKVAPGIRLNVSKSGVSTSFGPRGASVTVGKRGVRANVGIPGTGISYSEQLVSRNKRPQRLAYESVNNNTVPDAIENQQEVEKYNAYINMLTSVHLEVENDVDWTAIANEDLSYILNEGPNVKSVKAELNNYTPTLRDKLFNRISARKDYIQAQLPEAKSLDQEYYLKKQKLQNISYKVMKNDYESWIKALYEINPFDDIEDFGSEIDFEIINNELVAQLSIGNDEVVPSHSLSLTSTGKLSRKQMGKTKYLALYQDYVCSCVIRIAREVFAILPTEKVLINVYDYSQADDSQEQGCILSTRVHKEDLSNLPFDIIDCSDTIETFEHNMKYLKTKGFRIVEELV